MISPCPWRRSFCGAIASERADETRKRRTQRTSPETTYLPFAFVLKAGAVLDAVVGALAMALVVLKHWGKHMG